MKKPAISMLALSCFVIASVDGSTLCSATALGGASGEGTVFALNVNGADALPKPSTWAMLTGGIGLLILFRRRR